MKYFINKLGALIFTMIFLSLSVFWVFQMLPGNTAMVILGPDADPIQLEILTERLGLNLPPHIRYINWMKSALTGDLGVSTRYNLPVAQILKTRLPITVQLAVMSMIMAVAAAIPLGIITGKYANRPAGRALSAVTQLFLAIPVFWLGLMLVLVFSVTFSMLPYGGYVPYSQNPAKSIESLILPALSLAAGNSALMVRFLKNSIVDNMNQDYVRTARSRGASESRVLFCHVLKNALIPMITVLGMMAAETLSGSIIIENVFSLPGVGQLIKQSIQSRDLPLLQTLSLYTALLVIIINFAVDMTYRIVDPRIK